MGDGGPAPGESRIRIRAKQRDLVRCEDAVPSEMVLGSVEKERLINDQGGGRGDAKQLVQQAVKPLGCIVPIGDVVGAGLETMRLHLLELGALGLARLRNAPGFLGENDDALVTEGD